MRAGGKKRLFLVVSMISYVNALTATLGSLWSSWISPRLLLLSSANNNNNISSVVPVEMLQIPETATEVHLIVLVHGYMGNPREMAYLKSSLQSRALQRMKSSVSETCFIVHSATANDGKTTDGIEAGGKRLAQEVNDMLDYVSKKSEKDIRVSLSFVGNSLGGLYARYALSNIPLNNVQPIVFCTTATPHLGVTKNTYVRIPAFMESIIGNVMLSTGRDLFRLTPVVEQMATNDDFVLPLRRFERRIAYVNAYGTDFQVPTATAAFLHESLKDPNHRVVTLSSGLSSSLVKEVLRVESLQREHAVSGVDKKLSSGQIAQRLDNMGWIKVFCDVRQSLWSVRVPRWWGESGDANNKILSQDADHMGQNTLLTSEELYKWFGSTQGVLTIPFGHTVMVANAKNDLYAQWNAAGRPLMDQLADEILDCFTLEQGEKRQQ